MSLAMVAVVAGGVAILVASRSDPRWRAAQIASQQRFVRYLRTVDAQAADANARELAQQAASDRQAAAAYGAAGRDAGLPASGGGARASGAASPAGPAAAPASGPTVYVPPTPPFQPVGFRAPLDNGPYVDCSIIGKVVSAQDYSSDLQTLYSPWLAPRFPSVDLIRTSAAVAGTTLCVDFTAKGSPSRSTFYEFDLGSPGSTSGPSLAVQVVFGPRGERFAGLKYPGSDTNPPYGAVRAGIGVAGNSTSLLIDRRVFPSYVPAPPWSWTAEGIAFTGLHSPQQVTDTDAGPAPVG